ncbi:hypothetical protein BGZ60DRAFT_437205 [Tricladium varicosporioides]|nr:hypothetical protein BGZ60DRAFT_437205 [Hymenoscyphus varicosporioides]
MDPRKIKSNQSAVNLTGSLDGNVGSTAARTLVNQPYEPPHDMEMTQSRCTCTIFNYPHRSTLQYPPIAQYYSARRPSDSANVHIEKEPIDASDLTSVQDKLADFDGNRHAWDSQWRRHPRQLHPTTGHGDLRALLGTGHGESSRINYRVSRAFKF